MNIWLFFDYFANDIETQTHQGWSVFSENLTQVTVEYHFTNDIDTQLWSPFTLNWTEIIRRNQLTLQFHFLHHCCCSRCYRHQDRQIVLGLGAGQDDYDVLIYIFHLWFPIYDQWERDAPTNQNGAGSTRWNWSFLGVDFESTHRVVAGLYSFFHPFPLWSSGLSTGNIRTLIVDISKDEKSHISFGIILQLKTQSNLSKQFYQLNYDGPDPIFTFSNRNWKRPVYTWLLWDRGDIFVFHALYKYALCM